MLIELTIRRKNGSNPTIDGVTYPFRPTTTGEHVCEVSDPDAIDRFLSIPGYRAFAGRPEFAGKVEFAPPAPASQTGLVGTQVATPNVADMDRDQLIAYADLIGMRKPHPAIGTDKLRGNVAAFLELRASGDNDEPAAPEEDPKE